MDKERRFSQFAMRLWLVFFFFLFFPPDVCVPLAKMREMETKNDLERNKNFTDVELFVRLSLHLLPGEAWD